MHLKGQKPILDQIAGVIFFARESQIVKASPSLPSGLRRVREVLRVGAGIVQPLTEGYLHSDINLHCPTGQT